MNTFPLNNPILILGQHTCSKFLQQLDLSTDQLQHLEANGILHDAHLAGLRPSG